MHWTPELTAASERAEAFYHLSAAIEMAVQHIDMGLSAVHAGDFVMAHSELWWAKLTEREPWMVDTGPPATETEAPTEFRLTMR